MRIENRMQLQLWREECKEKRQKENCCILVCGGTGCLAGGSDKIYARLKELTSNMDHVTVKIGEEIAHVGLKMSGCHGFCEMGPLVRIEPYNYLYLKVKLEDCEEIFEKTILHGEPVTRLMYEDNGHVYQTQEEIPFYAKQTRLVLRNCGHIDAEHIEDAMAVGAYESFEKAVFEMTPEAVIKTVTDAGLRGRGGAGFPAGRKWSQVASQPEKIRYVVCNGDEGDPGAFMDRSVMEGDPHRMIEGMMLAAYAVQAQEGYIYVRAEYPLAVRRLQIAIAQAEEKGLLGDNILGTGFSFKLHINRGAGAFVCGEGSALTASIEGKRGMPRVKPPRTVEQGLWEKPTVLNNVETYANIPMIIKNGADWYKNLIENMVWTIFYDISNKRSSNQITMGLLFLQLLNYMDKMEAGGRKFDTEIIANVYRYIEDHFKEGTLSELAVEMKVDVYWLSREIKKKSGKTYKELLQEKRMQQAVYLLINSRIAVSDIIEAVGYDNTSYFYRKFKERYGISPKEYRIENMD